MIRGSLEEGSLHIEGESISLPVHHGGLLALVESLEVGGYSRQLDSATGGSLRSHVCVSVVAGHDDTV